MGGAAVVLATAGNAGAMAATVGGISPQGELVTIGVTPEPLPISPIQLITPGVSVVGHPSGFEFRVLDADARRIRRVRVRRGPTPQQAAAE